MNNRHRRIIRVMKREEHGRYVVLNCIREVGVILLDFSQALTKLLKRKSIKQKPVKWHKQNKKWGK